MAESSWPTVAGGHAIDDVQWERMASGFSADGIIGSPTDPPVVYADSTGLQVKVRASRTGLVRGSGWYSGTTEFTRTVDSNSSGAVRIDLVVLRLTRSTREVTIAVKKGTAGAGVPTLAQDALSSGSGVWEVAVAQVTVASGATTINAGDVVAVTKYIGAGNTSARPKLFRMAPPEVITGYWVGTTAPTSDAVDAPGMFQNSRLSIDKQSPESELEIQLQLSGFASAIGRVTAGVRVMGSGYTSSNHIVTTHYFNHPQYIGTDLSPWFSTALVSMTNHSPHAHTVTPSQHNHGLTIPHQHHSFGGMLRIPNLAARTYNVQVWIYTSGIGFSMDYNDQIFFRLAEV